MRFRFSGLRRPARVAKLIRRECTALGFELGLSMVQDATARAYGYDSYHELKANVGKDEPSAWDEDVGHDVRAARRDRHVDALFAAGLPRPDAEHVVARVRPTARRLGTGLAANAGAWRHVPAARPIVVTGHGAHLPKRSGPVLLGQQLPPDVEALRVQFVETFPVPADGLREIFGYFSTGKSKGTRGFFESLVARGVLKATPLGTGGSATLYESR